MTDTICDGPQTLRRRRWSPAIALSVLLGVLLTACNAIAPMQVGDARDAEAVVEDWLRSVAGGAEDRGWRLLLPATQESLYDNDADAYVEEAAGADWSEFEWSIMPGTYWDGDWVVSVSVEGGTVNVPDFVLNRPIADRSCHDGSAVGIGFIVTLSVLGPEGIGEPARTGSDELGICP